MSVGNVCDRHNIFINCQGRPFVFLVDFRAERAHESQSESPPSGSGGGESQAGNSGTVTPVSYVISVDGNGWECVDNAYDSATLFSFCFSKMGLLLDLSPDGGLNDDGNDEDLEEELLKLMGGGGGGGRSQGRKNDHKG